MHKLSRRGMWHSSLMRRKTYIAAQNTNPEAQAWLKANPGTTTEDYLEHQMQQYYENKPNLVQLGLVRLDDPFSEAAYFPRCYPAQRSVDKAMASIEPWIGLMSARQLGAQIPVSSNVLRRV